MDKSPAMKAAITAFVPCAIILMILRYTGHLSDFAENIPFLETLVGEGLVVAPAAIPAMITYSLVFLASLFKKRS